MTLGPPWFGEADNFFYALEYTLLLIHITPPKRGDSN